MSTSTTLTGTSSTSAPTSTSHDTTTLYLFTFLATILTLFLLSASLVLRSYILRRRYRQRLQHALADGLFVDLDRSAFNDAGQFDPMGGFRRSTRRLGPKPILWDTWIHPVEKYDIWSSITPVAAYCSSSLLPSTLIASPQPSTAPPRSPPSLQAQPRSSFFSPLRLPSPFSLSSRPSSPLPRQTQIFSIDSSIVASSRSPPPTVPGSPDPSTHTEGDAAVLAVCVLVAMPDMSAPVHRLISDPKGKRVDPFESQAHQQSGDADPLLPSPGSLRRSGNRIPDVAVDEEGLPLLEFGVVETRIGKTCQ